MPSIPGQNITWTKINSLYPYLIESDLFSPFSQNSLKTVKFSRRWDMYLKLNLLKTWGYVFSLHGTKQLLDQIECILDFSYVSLI
jgi:hypothetical protein